ncbi:hypothetical protein [Chryseobacterium sp. ISL-6]|uniref:hypothetical protein n=1 Tax=Chryseobacterium sp. ISL-6 TaxID=2819143 RepID=UPI001BEB5C65|nr:hypothetical protein [Chryseobacterium sp. ISL-6]MBT2622228.1 hypothetical protein [Chryseobacterium sp. ISL-6]
MADTEIYFSILIKIKMIKSLKQGVKNSSIRQKTMEADISYSSHFCSMESGSLSISHYSNSNIGTHNRFVDE